MSCALAFPVRARSRQLLAIFCERGDLATLPAKSVGYTRAVAGDVEHLQFVQVNGVKLAYRLAGAGVPVFFVHGEGYSHELWTEQLEAFSKQHLFVSLRPPRAWHVG